MIQFVLFSLLHSAISVAEASRKADTIRLLNLEKRYEEAQDKCEKWGSFDRAAEPDLREFCAQSFWVNAESKNTIEAWQNFQEQWVGTDWEKQAFKREGGVALAALGDNAVEQAYLEIADQFAGYSVATDALAKAGSAAIRDVASVEDAKRIASEYPNHTEFSVLIDKYPGAFVTLVLENGAIKVQASKQIDVSASKTFWAYQEVDGSVDSWDATVKKHLDQAGLEPVFAMRAIQNNTGTAPTFPLCPLNSSTTGIPGMGLYVKEKVVFSPIAWADNCDNSSTAVLVFSNRMLKHVSFSPDRNISLDVQSGARKDFTSFVRRNGDAILFEQKIWVRVEKPDDGTNSFSFAVYPLSGAAPWLSDQPPGAFKITLDNTFKGTGFSQGWSVQGVGNGIKVIRPNDASEWVVPSGEIRLLSPLIQNLLGLDSIDVAKHHTPTVHWSVDKQGVSTQPPVSGNITVKKLDDNIIKALRYHISGAGFDLNSLEIFDGYDVDLDIDGNYEKVLRGSYQQQEVVLILDRDKINGNRTFIYTTDHAKNGNLAAPVPFAFLAEDQVIFAWSGIEDKQSYVEMLYAQDGSFVMATQ